MAAKRPEEQFTVESAWSSSLTLTLAHEAMGYPAGSLGRQLAVLRRREQAVESTLQQLLDAQVVSLARTVEQDGRKCESDPCKNKGTGTVADNVRMSLASPAFGESFSAFTEWPSVDESPRLVQPGTGRDVVGLRCVRDGIKNSLNSLIELKNEEEAFIVHALSSRLAALARIKSLVQRQTSIYLRLMPEQANESGMLGNRLSNLKEQCNEIDAELHRLQDRISLLQDQRKILKQRIVEAEDQREAGLSGYRGALRDTEKELSSLLQQPPIAPLKDTLSGADRSGHSRCTSAGFTFMETSLRRRTAELAIAWWESEAKLLEQEQNRVRTSRETLKAGNDAWSQATQIINAFESTLLIALKRLTDAGHDDGRPGSTAATTSRDVVAQMDQACLSLTTLKSQAENKQWSLLICAIGAELEALEAARASLQQMFPGTVVQ